jgi:hypothetical protein
MTPDLTRNKLYSNLYNNQTKKIHQQITTVLQISTYLEEQHDDGKHNFCNLCQEVHTDWAKFEFPVHFTHVDQYRL